MDSVPSKKVNHARPLKNNAWLAPVLVLLTTCGGADGDPGTQGPDLSGNPGGGLLLVEGLWTDQSGDGVQTALVDLENARAWGLQRRDRQLQAQRHHQNRRCPARDDGGQHRRLPNHGIPTLA